MKKKTKKSKIKKVSAWAEIDEDDGQILQLFIGKPNYRYESTYEGSKLIKIQITYKLSN